MVSKQEKHTSTVISVIAAYWVVSISMVYLNKILLSNDSLSIPAPLLITWFQCVVTCIICVCLGSLGEKSRNSGHISFLNEYPLINFSATSSWSVLPLSVAFVGMVALNNICLQLVEVSFYNVARSLSIVFNVLFTYLILGKKTSSLTVMTLLVVMLGFYVGIDGEIDFSLVGTIAGVLASVFVSLNSVFTSRVLPAVNNDKSLLLFYNNLNSSLLFIPLIIGFEWTVIAKHSEKFVSLLFWIAMVLTGVMGFAIGLVTVLQVKFTSPLTHNISGTAKAGVQSLLAFYLWGNQATFKGLCGIFLVLLGSGAYGWVQLMEQNPPPAPPSPPISTGGIAMNSLEDESKETDPLQPKA